MSPLVEKVMKAMRLCAGVGALAAGVTGCKPQTPAQKIENAAEDAAHEAKQGVERAKEKVDDATR